MSELKGWREIPIGGMILEAGNAEQYKTGGWRAFRPVWDAEKCIHCMQCWVYCPDSSILVDAEAGKMMGIDYDHCKGCGICASVCSVNNKVRRQAAKAGEGEVPRDDPRLCIAMVEEGKFQE